MNTNSDEVAAAKMLDQWFADMKADAWSEGFVAGVNAINKGEYSKNPYRKEA